MNLLQNLFELTRCRAAKGCCFAFLLCAAACHNSDQASNANLTPNVAAASETPIVKSAPATAAAATSSASAPRLVSSHASSAATANKNLDWQLVDGTTKSFADYAGKAVVLDFWATYCPPCEEEIPHLVELSNKYKKDLKVVGLHVGGDDDLPNVANFVSKYKMVYDLGFPEQGLMDFYLQGDDRIPQTFVFDRRGRLVGQFVGFTPEIKAEIDNAVQTAIASER